MSKYTIVNPETDRALSWATTLVAASRSAQQFSNVPYVVIRCGQRVVEEYRFGVLVVKSKPEVLTPVVSPQASQASKPKIVIRRRRRDKEDDEDDDT